MAAEAIFPTWRQPEPQILSSSEVCPPGNDVQSLYSQCFHLRGQGYDTRAKVSRCPFSWPLKAIMCHTHMLIICLHRFMKPPIVLLANTLFSVNWVPFHLCHLVHLLCHDHKKNSLVSLWVNKEKSIISWSGRNYWTACCFDHRIITFLSHVGNLCKQNDFLVGSIESDGADGC